MPQVEAGGGGAQRSVGVLREASLFGLATINEDSGHNSPTGPTLLACASCPCIPPCPPLSHPTLTFPTTAHCSSRPPLPPLPSLCASSAPISVYPCLPRPNSQVHAATPATARLPSSLVLSRGLRRRPCGPVLQVVAVQLYPGTLP